MALPARTTNINLQIRLVSLSLITAVYIKLRRKLCILCVSELPGTLGELLPDFFWLGAETGLPHWWLKDDGTNSSRTTPVCPKGAPRGSHGSNRRHIHGLLVTPVTVEHAHVPAAVLVRKSAQVPHLRYPLGYRPTDSSSTAHWCVYKGGGVSL